MAIQEVFNIAAVQSWIKRYVDTLIYGKYSQSINNIATDRPIFFAKMKKNSTSIFNLKVDGPTMGGTICMAVSVGDTDNLENSAISILSTSIPAFFSSSNVYLATGVDSIVSDYIFVGFSVVTNGLFDISLQAVSSERRGVIGVEYSISLAAVSASVTFPVSDGYLAGFPVVRPIRELDAFRKWSPLYDYEAEDPVFYNGAAYFANPALLPLQGESPSSHPEKWIQLARPDPGPMDISDGARTPQVFYQPGIIISNTNALALRMAHQDQGMAYPSLASKVYHLDGDLLDQDQENELTIIEMDPGEEDYIEPHFISDDSDGEDLVTTNPAIPKKPFKEIPESYFGTYGVKFTLPNGANENILDFWFKPIDCNNQNILSIELPTGELYNLILGFEEPFWNDNYGAEPGENFPFNELSPVPYNERSYSAGLSVVQSFNTEISNTVIPLAIKNVPQPDAWSHISIRIGIDSILVFLNGQQIDLPRITTGLDDVTEITINPSLYPIVLDEILIDWTTNLDFERFLEISSVRLPWAFREWKDGWFTLYANDPDKVDSNLVMHFFPVGSVMTQASVDGVYDDSQLPWNKFTCFKESQFNLQGEVSPASGTGQKTKFWQRIS